MTTPGLIENTSPGTWIAVAGVAVQLIATLVFQWLNTRREASKANQLRLDKMNEADVTIKAREAILVEAKAARENAEAARVNAEAARIQAQAATEQAKQARSVAVKSSLKSEQALHAANNVTEKASEAARLAEQAAKIANDTLLRSPAQVIVANDSDHPVPTSRQDA